MTAGLVVAALAVTACGSSDDGEPVLDPASTAADAGTDTAAEGTAASAEEPADEPAAATPAGGTTAGDPATGKPSIQLPAEQPTELVITDLVEGSGEPAAVGDSISVQYVGVLSKDGTEFDSNWGSGTPFSLVLGVGNVIQGWDEGLVGVKQGGVRQLDIPASLAYGDQGAGGVIGPGDALTFVVEVVSLDKRVAPTPPPMADPSECPAPDGSDGPVREFTEYPPFCIDVTKTYTAEIVTNFGDLTVELFPELAPLTVNNFVVLARYGYFDGTECHRAIPGFVVQCGDPTATGTGGPGYRFEDELPLPGEYRIGSLAMANAGPDTNGSQFFIITGPDGTALPPQYSLFGRVTEGLDTTLPEIDGVANPADNGVPPLDTIRIDSVTITES